MKNIAPEVENIKAWLVESYDISTDQAGRLIDAFRDSVSDTLAILKKNIADADLHGISQSAHKIKGSLRQVGLFEAGEIALSMEQAASKGEKIDYSGAVDILEEMLKPVILPDGKMD